MRTRARRWWSARGGWTGIAIALWIAVPATVIAIGTISEVRLEDGVTDVNRLASPVYDGSGTPVRIGTITRAYDQKARIVRRGATGFFTRGPEYNLDKSVDLAVLFGNALGNAAGAMGFAPGTSADAWQVDGTLKDVYLESKQIPYGATLFYGYMDVELSAKRGADAPQTSRMRLHAYTGGYNAGLGRKDEASAALAMLLVEGAQEALARLNRTLFKAAPHPSMLSLSKGLEAGTVPEPAALHAIGLSGVAGAAAPLLAALPKEVDENRRSAIIEALGRLGAPEAVPVLAGRYQAEDEDCRWYTLKAMDYIGGDTAIALVRERGRDDPDGGPRRLAERITKTSN